MRWIGSEGRPGLPPEGYGRVLRDRPLRVRLGGGGQRARQYAFALRCAGTGGLLCRLPRLRFSVALPLGINAAGPRGAKGWNYPNY